MNSSGGVTKRPNHTVADHADERRRRPSDPQGHGRTVGAARQRRACSSVLQQRPEGDDADRDIEHGEDHEHVQPATCTAGCSGEGLVPGLGRGEQDRGDHGQEEKGQQRLAIRSPDATTP